MRYPTYSIHLHIGHCGIEPARINHLNSQKCATSTIAQDRSGCRPLPIPRDRNRGNGQVTGGADHLKRTDLTIRIFKSHGLRSNSPSTSDTHRGSAGIARAHSTHPKLLHITRNFRPRHGSTSLWSADRNSRRCLIPFAQIHHIKGGQLPLRIYKSGRRCSRTFSTRIYDTYLWS